jgi:hypothetical protein
MEHMRGKKGDWFVGDYVIQLNGLELDVPGSNDGYGGGYRDGMVAVLSAMRGVASKHALNGAFEEAVEHFAVKATTRLAGDATNNPDPTQSHR